MNQSLRMQAAKHDRPMVDYLLAKMKALKKELGVSYSLFAVCPNSRAVIRASLRSAKRNHAPIKFAATLNQVDLDGGYTGLTPYEFVKTIRLEARAINLKSPVIIAIDHGGPWLKDKHNVEKFSYHDSMESVKRSFEAAIEAGYDLIHVDPTIDITLSRGEIISIDVVAQRTVELIVHVEKFRKKNKYPRIAYEVGTEEVHGGLADMDVFVRFLELLKRGLIHNNLHDVWPCFIVGKVGTDLHTSTFDPHVARQLVAIAERYGSVIKGHYSDNVTNPEDYPASGMGAANVGPEFTEKEYEGLIELCDIEEELYKKDRVIKPAGLCNILWETVIQSGRWKKWLLEGESADNFYDNAKDRQVWLVKTGCRYIWENPNVVAARARLYSNLAQNGIDAEAILSLHIEKAMDKYFYKFNLVNFNDLIEEKESTSVI
jgi:D-tagatose-1,6-bisphosphate aldolase subunit GatZ/KbaZ